MGSFYHDSFVFTALSDFRAEDDPNLQLALANEFGIRIIACNSLRREDWHIIKGPFRRFRMRIMDLILGSDQNEEFFIRRIEANKGSEMRVYYYDLKTKKDAIIGIRRRPGLAITFRSGVRLDYRLDVISMCSREYELCFLSNGDRFVVE